MLLCPCTPLAFAVDLRFLGGGWNRLPKVELRMVFLPPPPPVDAAFLPSTRASLGPQRPDPPEAPAEDVITTLLLLCSTVRFFSGGTKFNFFLVTPLTQLLLLLLLPSENLRLYSELLW